ncbi:BatA domain-containing protein [bacterium]|nr:BatA domain-containing protein [bacterium]
MDVLQFLNPLVLIGLAAGAIPFIIHFFSRFRAERREFSSLLLLSEVAQRNVRRLRMRRWLLLALRTLAVVLLVLVPARPMLRGFFQAGPEEHLPAAVAFVFDNSASMGYVDEHGAVNDRLAARLERVCSWLGGRDRWRLVTAPDGLEASQNAQWLVSGGPGPSGALLAPGYGTARLGEAVRAAEHALAAERGTVTREGFIFSDCQRGFLGPDSLGPDITGAITRWYVIEGHSRAPENLALTGLSLPGEIVRPGAPLKVRVEVARYGGAGTAKAMPRLYLDGHLVGQGELSLEPDAASAATVELPPQEAGSYELSARLDADNLEVDNSRSILLTVPPRLRVTLVEGGASGPWLRAALEVLDGAGAISLGGAAGLPLPQTAFTGSDVIVLHGVNYPEAALGACLDRALSAGLGVLVLPSGQDQAADGAAQGFSQAAARLGLPVSLGALERLGGGSFDTPARPGPGQESGAVFGALFESLPALVRIKLTALRNLSQPEAVGDGGQAWDLASAGGKPVLRLVRQGGFALALAGLDLADPAQTELPETPLFVPLVHSLLTLCASRGPVVQPEVRVGESVSLFFGAPSGTGGLEIHGPAESRFMLPPGERSRVDFDGARQPGLYRIYDNGRPAGAFAAGIDPAESDVRPESREEIRRYFAGREVRFVGPDDNLAEMVFPDRGGVELWPWLLGLFLLVLAAEQLLANRKED